MATLKLNCHFDKMVFVILSAIILCGSCAMAVTYREEHSVYGDEVLLDEGRHGLAHRGHALHLARQRLGES